MNIIDYFYYLVYDQYRVKCIVCGKEYYVDSKDYKTQKLFFCRAECGIAYMYTEGDNLV